jgi:hypothetical protein
VFLEHTSSVSRLDQSLAGIQKLKRRGETAPFVVMQVAVYQMATALSARSWFALEICQHTEAMAHVCDAKSESGDLCMWRFGMLRVLESSALKAAVGSSLSQYVAQLSEAVSKGPYGVAGSTGKTTDVEPQVASRAR